MIGIGTSIYETGLSTLKTGAVFEDRKNAIGTAVLCWSTGSGGTLVIEKQLRSSGTWAQVSSESVTAGTALIIEYRFPLGKSRAKFTPTSTSTLVEVEFASKGGE